MKRNIDTIGREDGSKVEEGNIIQFTQEPDASEHKGPDMIIEADVPARPIIDPATIKGLDTCGLSGLCDAYYQITEYMGRDPHYDHINVDVEEFRKVAEHYKKYHDIHQPVIDALGKAVKQISEIKPLFENLGIDATIRGQNTPESVRKSIVKKFDSGFNTINTIVASYETTANDDYWLKDRIEEVNEMYKELNESNKINGVGMLTKNIEINLTKIRDGLVLRDEDLDAYDNASQKTITNSAAQRLIRNIYKTLDFSNGKTTISYSYASDGPYDFKDNTVYLNTPVVAPVIASAQPTKPAKKKKGIRYYITDFATVVSEVFDRGHSDDGCGED